MVFQSRVQKLVKAYYEAVAVIIVQEKNHYLTFDNRHPAVYWDMLK